MIQSSWTLLAVAESTQQEGRKKNIRDKPLRRLC